MLGSLFCIQMRRMFAGLMILHTWLIIADDPSEGDMSYDWFGCDPRQSDFPLKLNPETLGFDDFMTSAARAGADVNLVVPLDGASEFHGDDQIRTRSIGVEEMLRTATEWVSVPV